MTRAGLFLIAIMAGLSGAHARAEETEEDPEVRKEALLRLVQSMEEGSAKQPTSVLDGFDPRTAAAAELKTARALRRTRASIALEKTDIPGALEILRAASGLNFVLSAKAKQVIETEKPLLTLKLDDLPLENVLNLIALQLPDMRFAVRYGAVVLVRNEEWKPRRILRVYDVSDLVRRPPDFPAPKLGLGDTDAAGGR